MDVNDDRQAHSERELVAAVARGDQRAFAELFDRHVGPAQQMLSRLGVTAVSMASALHEVFLAFWRAAPRMNPAVPVQAQLLALALLHQRGAEPAEAEA